MSNVPALKLAAPDCTAEELFTRNDVWNGLAPYHVKRLIDRVLRLMQSAEKIAEDGTDDPEAAHLLERVRAQTSKPYTHPAVREFFHEYRHLWMDIDDAGSLKVREGYWRRSDDPQEPSPGADDIRRLEKVSRDLDDMLEQQSIPGIIADHLRAVRQRVISWLIPYRKTTSPALRAA